MKPSQPSQSRLAPFAVVSAPLDAVRVCAEEHARRIARLPSAMSPGESSLVPPNLGRSVSRTTALLALLIRLRGLLRLFKMAKLLLNSYCPE